MSFNELKLSNIIKSPVISEKSTLVGEKVNTFVFKVEQQASKKEVKDAVELMFKVEVESVQVLNMKGKQKRFGRVLGKRQDWKKAYVKLKPGNDIEFSVA